MMLPTDDCLLLITDDNFVYSGRCSLSMWYRLGESTVIRIRIELTNEWRRMREELNDNNCEQREENKNWQSLLLNNYKNNIQLLQRHSGKHKATSTDTSNTTTHHRECAALDQVLGTHAPLLSILIWVLSLVLSFSLSTLL